MSNSSDDPSESQNRNLETRIVGGSFAGRKRFPYFALISMVKDGIPNYSYYGYCGGTLVARDVVITAATCVVDSHENSTNVWVNASSFQSSKYVYHRQVRKFVLHPKFEYSYYDANMENNIALIFLDKPVMGVPLVKLNRNASVPLSSDPPPLTAIGLGATFMSTWSQDDIYFQEPERLKRITIKKGSMVACKKWYGSLIGKSHFCAGNGTEELCFGDEGGPLIMKKLQVTKGISKSVFLASPPTLPVVQGRFVVSLSFPRCRILQTGWMLRYASTATRNLAPAQLPSLQQSLLPNQ